MFSVSLFDEELDLEHLHTVDNLMPRERLVRLCITFLFNDFLLDLVVLYANFTAQVVNLVRGTFHVVDYDECRIENHAFCNSKEVSASILGLVGHINATTVGYRERS